MSQILSNFFHHSHQFDGDFKEDNASSAKDFNRSLGIVEQDVVIPLDTKLNQNLSFPLESYVRHSPATTLRKISSRNKLEHRSSSSRRNKLERISSSSSRNKLERQSRSSSKSHRPRGSTQKSKSGDIDDILASRLKNGRGLPEIERGSKRHSASSGELDAHGHNSRPKLGRRGDDELQRTRSHAKLGRISSRKLGHSRSSGADNESLSRNLIARSRYARGIIHQQRSNISKVDRVNSSSKLARSESPNEQTRSGSAKKRTRGGSYGNLGRRRISADLAEQQANSSSRKFGRTRSSGGLDETSGDLMPLSRSSRSDLSSQRFSRRVRSNGDLAELPSLSRRGESFRRKRDSSRHSLTDNGSPHSTLKPPVVRTTYPYHKALSSSVVVAAALGNEYYKKDVADQCLEDNCTIMKEAVNQMRAQLFAIELGKNEDIYRLKHSLNAEKEWVREELIKTQGQEMEKLQWQQLDAEQEIMALETDQKKIQAEIAKLEPMIRDLQEENDKLGRTNEKIHVNFESLSNYTLNLTARHEKRKATKERISKILRGAMARTIEPNLKQIYRGYMYKCAKSVRTADRPTPDLYEDVLSQILACESELRCKVQHEDGDFSIQRVPSSLKGLLSKSQLLDLVMKADDEDATEIDVRTFVEDAEKQCDAIANLYCVVSDTQMSTLSENKDILLTVFNFLDVDGSGTIDKEELKFGIDLLNQRLRFDAKFNDHEVLFGALDVDGSGGINLEEFNLIFSQNSNIGGSGGSSS
jgi:Ca2+-binding EF-hand superfamily protein